jgi:hypothetical protein
MSIQDEQELRRRLGLLLDNVEPRPAPVGRTAAQGRGIRMRRWISAAAGLAVIAAGALVLPGLLAGHRVAPSAPLHYQVTVRPVGANARAGLIGQGVTDGKPWRVVISGTAADLTTSVLGWPSTPMTTAPLATGSPASFQVMSGGPGADNANVISGTVAPAVTAVAISLPDGEIATLTPVRWHQYRFVAVLLPWRVRVVRAVAYAGDREIAYAVPFGDAGLDTWWAPGQAGPRRLTKPIGSGVVAGHSWYATAKIGPWGYCYTTNIASTCVDATTNPQLVSAGQVVNEMSCSPLGGAVGGVGPAEGFAAAASNVRSIVLRFSDGTDARFPAVLVAGNRMFGYAVPAHVKVVRILAYGAAGQLTGSVSGTGWAC